MNHGQHEAGKTTLPDRFQPEAEHHGKQVANNVFIEFAGVLGVRIYNPYCKGSLVVHSKPKKIRLLAIYNLRFSMASASQYDIT